MGKQQDGKDAERAKGENEQEPLLWFFQEGMREAG